MVSNGRKKKVVELDSWELLNMSNDNALKLYHEIFSMAYPSGMVKKEKDVAYK